MHSRTTKESTFGYIAEMIRDSKQVFVYLETEFVVTSWGKQHSHPLMDVRMLSFIRELVCSLTHGVIAGSLRERRMGLRGLRGNGKLLLNTKFQLHKIQIEVGGNGYTMRANAWAMRTLHMRVPPLLSFKVKELFLQIIQGIFVFERTASGWWRCRSVCVCVFK